MQTRSAKELRIKAAELAALQSAQASQATELSAANAQLAPAVSSYVQACSAEELRIKAAELAARQSAQASRAAELSAANAQPAAARTESAPMPCKQACTRSSPSACRHKVRWQFSETSQWSLLS